MKKIFVVSDTHNNCILPDTKADIKIHCGDFIEIFSFSSTDYFNDINACITEYACKFDYAVCGNHEDSCFSSVAKYMRSKNLNTKNYEWLTKLRDVYVQKSVIETIRFRISHYLNLDKLHIYNTLSIDEEFEKMQEIAESNKYDVVIFGHTHRQFYKKINNTHFINPGFGAENEYAEIIIEGNEVSVEITK